MSPLRPRTSTVRRAARVLGLACAVWPGLALGAVKATPAPLRHLVLITVDTLRADSLSIYGRSDVRDPALEALAEQSLLFDEAYAHASMTLPSIASLMTGRLPAAHGLLDNHGALPQGLDTLAQRLAAAGFDSAAFVGNYALRRSRGLDRGFAHYTDSFVRQEGVRARRENSAADLNAQALAWLASRDPARRLFLWIHYQEPHGPYLPAGFRADPHAPAELVLPRSASHSGFGAIPRYQWLGHGRLAEYRARYAAEVRSLDRPLAELIAALRTRGLLDEALLVFTADHGESFGENGLYCAHGEGLDPSLLHVPLLLRIPGEPAARRRDRVRSVDVAPTALALLGLDALGSGRSLLEAVGDRTLVAQSKTRSRHWRSLWRGELRLDEEQERDPVLSAAAGSTIPPERAAALRQQLARLAPWKPAAAAKPTPLAPGEADALRALGYVD